MSKQPEEYRKFKELAARLIAVPKKEIDRQKATTERDKQKKEKAEKVTK
jgi:hypothetical protein